MAEWEAEYGSDTEERKAHIAYQRRVRGRAKGDSSRRSSGLPLLASSAKNKGKRKQTSEASGSTATSVPKSRPSCASTGVGELTCAPFSWDTSEDED